MAENTRNQDDQNMEKKTGSSESQQSQSGSKSETPNRGLGSVDEDLQRNVSTKGDSQSSSRSNDLDSEDARNSDRTNTLESDQRSDRQDADQQRESRK